MAVHGTPTSIGAVANKNSTTLSLTTTASVPAGATIFVFVVLNGNFTSSYSLSDSASNTYVVDNNALLYLNGSNPTNGVIMIWRCSNASALASGQNITFSVGAGAQALSALYITGVSATDVVAYNGGIGSGTAVSIPLAPTLDSSKTYTTIMGLIVNGPSGDTFTQASLWAAPPTRIGTTGAGATTNHTVAGGYRNFTGVTTVTYAPTLGTSRAWAGLGPILVQSVPRTLYWVGGNGTWDTTSTTNWSLSSGGTSGQSPPTSIDDIIIDSASGSPTITMTGALNAKSITTTGATCTFATGTSPTLALAGNMTLSSTTTWTSTAPITISSSGSQINANGVTISASSWTLNGTVAFLSSCTTPGTFSGSGGINVFGGTWTQNGTVNISGALNVNGGSVQLNAALTASASISLASGTMTLGAVTVTTALFDSNYSNTRTLDFGSSGGAITLTGNNTTIWNSSTTTGFTVSGTPVVNCTYSGATGTRTVTTGTPSEDNTISFYVTAGSDSFKFTDFNNYRTLDFTGFSGTLTSVDIQPYGSLALSSTMTVLSNLNFGFHASQGSWTVKTAGKVFLGAYFDGSNGAKVDTQTYTFLDALTTTSLIRFGSGTFNLNGKVLSGGVIDTFGTVPTINFQSGYINATGGNNTVVYFPNVPIVSGTPIINLTYAGSTGTRSVSTGTPTEANVISFNVTAGTDTVSMSSCYVNSLSFSGFSGSFSTGGTGMRVYGNLTFSTGMTVGSLGSIIYAATSGTQTITSNGKSHVAQVSFGLGAVPSTATYLLADAFTATSGVLFFRGTLSLNNNALTTTVMSVDPNATTLAFGTGSINLTGSSNQIWNSSAATSTPTITGTPIVNCTYSGATGTRSVATGQTIEANALSFNVTGGTDIFYTNDCVFKSLNFTGFSGSWDTFGSSAYIYGSFTASAGMNTTNVAGITLGATSGSWTVSSAGALFSGAIVSFGDNSVGQTQTYTLNSAFTAGSLYFKGGTLALSTNTLTCSAFVTGFRAGTLNFGTGAITVTGNGYTVFDILDSYSTMTVSGTPVVNLTYSGSVGTRTIRVPYVTESNTISFNVTGGTDKVEMAAITNSNEPYVRSLNFTGFSGSFYPHGTAFDGTQFNVFGNITLSPGMTVVSSTYGRWNLYGSGTQLITSNGNSLVCDIYVGGTGTVRLADAAICSYMTVWGSNLDLNGKTLTTTNYGFSVDYYNTNAYTITFNGGTIYITGAGGYWYAYNGVSNVNVDMSSVSSIVYSTTSNVATSFVNSVYLGGSLVVSTLAPIQFTGSSNINTLTNTVAGGELRFRSVDTLTVNNFNISGNSTTRFKLRSVTTGNRYTLSKSSGSVRASYLDIKDSTATGGATWTAVNSIDSGNNTGWTFTYTYPNTWNPTDKGTNNSLLLSNGNRTVLWQSYEDCGIRAYYGYDTSTRTDSKYFTITYDANPTAIVGLFPLSSSLNTRGTWTYTNGALYWNYRGFASTTGSVDPGLVTQGDVITIRVQGTNAYIKKNSGTELGPIGIGQYGTVYPMVMSDAPNAQITADFTNWATAPVTDTSKMMMMFF